MLRLLSVCCGGKLPASHLVGVVNTRRSVATPFARSTPPCFAGFSLKDKILAERKARERERMGLSSDPDDEDTGVSMDDEERARLLAAEQARQRELETLARNALEERNKADASKRDAFKKFRASQLHMSEKRKEATTGKRNTAASRLEQRLADKTLSDDDQPPMPPGTTVESAQTEATDGGDAAPAATSTGSEGPRSSASEAR